MNCAIKVGNSQELSRIVQEFLFSKGYVWPGYLREIINHPVMIYEKDTVIIVREQILAYSNMNCYGYTIFDAATEMGKIIEFFSQPEYKQIAEIPDTKVLVHKDGAVTYGCTKLKSETVEKIIKARAEFIK